ncbi:glycosyltransferase [Paracraurococcus lichenis]|uniref:Glycosyltransferase n=1 Tax=Paracraurococcus lichenis TaxID=3064888 RepID=A0ABT9EBU7_9PROT|nr:glycosyltransferase [Paracraurococcus sp. LOR1-02]MDO9713370.1 glycosyltransferase [Paracraurococcus sp. LOR1-02]
MKVALVTDSMSAFGGAERVIEQILRIFPQADIFAVLDLVPKLERGFLGAHTITTSFLQKLPAVKFYYRKLLHFWPIAVEQIDVTGYDLVLSSHHSVAYGVLTNPDQIHVSYVHTPMRYAWDLQHEYLRSAHLEHGLLGLAARRTLHKARIWDYAAAQRPDALVTNSHFVARRLHRTHRRDVTVIYPPVSVQNFEVQNKGDYYISVGRLVPYKRVDLLARAFARMPERRLKIVGTGPELKKLSALQVPNVEVLGYQSDEVVRDLLSGARAFLFAGIEDFGITAVEAQAAGTPVIAYGCGGLTETVLDLSTDSQPTGLFFDEQSEDAIVDAVHSFEANRERFTPEACISNAERFSDQRFRSAFSAFVHRAVSQQRRNKMAFSSHVTPHRQPALVPNRFSAD